MKRLSIHKATVTAFVCLALCSIAHAQGAPDLTGNSGHGALSGAQGAPDLTGKSSNARFNPNFLRAKSGAGPDLTGKVQEDRRPISTPASASTGSGSFTLIVLVCAALGIVLGAGVMMTKQKV